MRELPVSGGKVSCDGIEVPVTNLDKVFWPDEKITKAEREFVFNWLNFTLPNRIRMTKRRAAAKIITFQPPANFSDRNSSKPRSFRYSIKSRI